MTDTATTAPARGVLLQDAPTNGAESGPDDEVGALDELRPDEVLAASDR